ncbi:MAG: VWA domain-containing protein [Pseudomonadota bacterium]
MRFANPYLLNLLWILLPVSAILVYGMLKRNKILLAFAQPDMLPSIIPGFDPLRRWIKTILIILASAFAIAAMAGPQMGFRWEKIKQRGVDIMIALDCSKSMLAQDIAPNRLERAKREIVDLLRMMKSDRAGLVAFSGNAILQCPLTLDHEAFNIFLKVLEPDFLPTGGTNLEAAIQTCYSGFEKETDTQKAIILITDGENTSGDVENTVQQMAKEGIKIFCIGVGNREGAPIPDEAGGFKKDQSGNIVLSKVDETGLEKIAAMTDGAYVRSVAGDMDLDLIYKDKIQGTMEQKTLVSGKKKVWENRYQWFLFPGLVLLLVEFFLLPVKRSGKWLGKQPGKHSGLLVFLLVAGMAAFQPAAGHAQSVTSSVKQGVQEFDSGQYEQARKHFIDAQLKSPDDERLYYNIGTAAYMAKDYEQARKNFAQAKKSKDIALRHDAQYNLANTDYQLGNLDEAIKGYEQLLKEFPDDTQAKENLEFVRQKKREQQQSESKQDQDKQDKDKQDRDKQNKDQEKSSDSKQNSEDKKEDQNTADQSQNKDQNQDNQSGKDENSDQKEQQASSQKDQDKPQKEGQDQTPPPPRQDPDDDQGRSVASKGQQPLPDNQNMEKMLNRLEDKPGRAMIPMGQETKNGKDW